MGSEALYSNTTGYYNTANGSFGLQGNTTGHDNTANGAGALLANTTGLYNTAIGSGALKSNTVGISNTATGGGALLSNTTGTANTAVGAAALRSNTVGIWNTANGESALESNTTGNYNTADGLDALFRETTGSFNIALGYAAGSNLSTGSNNIDIGNVGLAGESNIIRIGNEVAVTDLEGVVHPAHTKTFVAGIHGATVASGVGVIVGSNGQLGRVVSSARFKEAIKPMDKASGAILALQPVTFRYKHELDPDGIPQFGLVAEQVEKVNPDLVARDADGKVYTVRYEAVNAMLLNEFLKEHRKVEEQGAVIAEQQKQIEALTAGLREVSDQIRRSKSTLQVVAANQ